MLRMNPKQSIHRSRRPGRIANALHGVRPVVEVLEKRLLLSFDLHNGVLRETFDEQDVGIFQLLAGWDDDEFIPATSGSGQGPQLVSPAIPLFHHQLTIPSSGYTADDSGAVDRTPGDTTIVDDPFISRALVLLGATDTITFPDVQTQNNEAVTLADIDVMRESNQTEAVTFVGTGDSETITDTFTRGSAAPPAVIFAVQGSAGSGNMGVVPGSTAPTTPGWDTIAASRDDIGIHGKPIGPITEIILSEPGQDSATFDNVRVFVGYATPPNNSPPTAVDDTGYSVSPGDSIDIPVLANDSDPDGDPIHLVSVGRAALGTTTIDPAHPDEVLYTASGPFTHHGPDTFSYTVADKYNATATATVTVLVNTPPTAPDLTISVPHGTTGTFILTKSDGLFSKGVGDADGDKLTLTATDGMYGKVSLNQDGSFTYARKDGGLVTADSFQYTVSDGFVTKFGTVNLVPDNPHLAPNPTPDSLTLPVPHGYTGSYTSAAPGIFATNPRADGDGDPLVPIVVTGPGYGTVVFNRAGNGTYDGTFTYTPDTLGDFVQSDTFQYALFDGYAESTPATVQLVVANNHPPPTPIPDTFTVDPGVTGLYTSPAPGIFKNNPQRDADGDALIPLVEAEPNYGTVVFDRASDGTYDGTFTYTPSTPNGLIPDDSFKYEFTDGYDYSASATVTLVGVTPLAIATTNENFPYTLESPGVLGVAHGTPGPLTANVHVSDAAGRPVTLTVSDQAEFGHVLVYGNGTDDFTYQYDPPTIADYDGYTGVTTMVSRIDGDDHFTLEASDGRDVADLVVTYQVADQAPEIEPIATAETGLNPPVTPAQGPTFMIPENTGLSYYSRANTGSDPSPVSPIQYDPSLDYPGLVHFAAPGVLLNSSDPDLQPGTNRSEPLMAIPDFEDPPQHGGLSLNPDGSFNYTPDEGFQGTDSFGYFASDGYQPVVGGIDVRVVSWGDGSDVPTAGNSIAFVGIDNNSLLHIRLFAADGNMVIDADETNLTSAQAGAISALKQQLPNLLPPHVLSSAEKAEVVSAVTSIVGADAVNRSGRAVIHPFFATIVVTPSGAADGDKKFNLQVVSWGDGSGVPMSGQSLVIAGIDYSGLLHIRVFDSTGTRVADTDETQLPQAQAGPISTLKQQLSHLLSQGVVTPDEQAQVISEATAIVGQSRGEPFEFAPVLLDKHYGLNLTPDGLSSGVIYNDSITYGDLVVSQGGGYYPGDVSYVRQPAFQLLSLTRDTVDFPQAAPFFIQYSNEDFPDGVDFSLVPHVANPDPNPGFPIIGAETIPLADTLFSFDYVNVNQYGWISNIARVFIDVNSSDEVSNVALSVETPNTSHYEQVFVSAPGTDLLVSNAPPSRSVPIPSGVELLGGQFISITVSDVPVGGPTTVTITLPADYPNVSTYYKFDRLDNTFYQFVQGGGPAGLGAVFSRDPTTGQEIITLHLQDGGWGDDDGTRNGVIMDPGALVVYTDPARNLVASLYEDVLGRSPREAEMAYWVRRLDSGESRFPVAESFWNSREHRRLQVEQWSGQFLGHPAGPVQRARWVGLLRSGAGETAVQARILASPEYRRAHPTAASFVAGLYRDVLGQAADPIDPSSAIRLRRERRTSRARLARQVLTSPAAARLLAQGDATGFLGRLATGGEAHRDAVKLRRSPAAAGRIAARILGSASFYEFVNSALDLTTTGSRHPRGH